MNIKVAKKTILLSAFLVMASAIPLYALAEVTFKNGWIRATVEGQHTTGAFVELISTQDAVVTEVRTPVALHAEIHSMETKKGVMKMRHVSSFVLPANRPITLAPGQKYHIMLNALKKPLAAGEHALVTFIVRDHLARTSKSYTTSMLVRQE